MKKAWVVHPFLLALWPVLFVYSQNVEQISLSQFWRPVLLLLGSTAAVLLLFFLLLKSAMRAGLLLSLFLFLFFSYGQTLRILLSALGTDSATSEPLVLMIIWIVVYLAGVALFARVREGLNDGTKIANVVVTVLIMIPTIHIALYELKRPPLWSVEVSVEPIDIEQTRPVQPDALPDIYYIILDGYARADVLADLYDLDNSGFIGFLEQKGFFVAQNSQANYSQTALCMASSLNMTYLDDLAARMGPASWDLRPLRNMIADSTVIQFLKRQGYSIDAFRSGISMTDLSNAQDGSGETLPLDELAIGILGSTPIPWLVPKQSDANLYASHARTIRYILDHLADTAQLPSPHFVFAHILVPHPPFMFDEGGQTEIPDGEFKLDDGGGALSDGDRQEYREGYRAQVLFVNSRMKTVLDELISSLSRPSIIILQSDHGPASLMDWDHPENSYFKERMTILNAYLLPGGGAAGLYDEITPANTFRLIFDTYFGTDLGRLADRSYLSAWARPYEFIDITDEVRSGQPAQIRD
jgi:hypothetical protein